MWNLDVAALCVTLERLWYVMSTGLIFRAAGVGSLQRATAALGPGLWPLPASSPGWPGALLHPVPTRLPECFGLRVDFHLLVSWPVSSKGKEKHVANGNKTLGRHTNPKNLIWNSILTQFYFNLNSAEVITFLCFVKTFVHV